MDYELIEIDLNNELIQVFTIKYNFENMSKSMDD